MGKGFAAQLAEVKKREFAAGLQQGIEFCKLISGIALNNLHGFGVKRIDEYEAEVDRLLQQEVAGRLPEELVADLERRLEKMR